MILRKNLKKQKPTHQIWYSKCFHFHTVFDLLYEYYCDVKAENMKWKINLRLVSDAKEGDITWRSIVSPLLLYLGSLFPCFLSVFSGEVQNGTQDAFQSKFNKMRLEYVNRLIPKQRGNNRKTEVQSNGICGWQL